MFPLPWVLSTFQSPSTCMRWWHTVVGVLSRSLQPESQHHQDALHPSRPSDCRSELTQTSQDEKNFKSKCYSSGSSKDTLCGDPEGHTRLWKSLFLVFCPLAPSQSLHGGLSLSLTTAACCLWRPGESGAAPDICRPGALGCLALSFSFCANTRTHALTHARARTHAHGAHSLASTKGHIHPSHTVSTREEVVWSSQALALFCHLSFSLFLQCSWFFFFSFFSKPCLSRAILKKLKTNHTTI